MEDKLIVKILFFSLAVVILILSIFSFIKLILFKGNNTSSNYFINFDNYSYVYKDELLDLEYTIDEIKIINEKIKKEDVSLYLLNKKYNNLIDFLSSPYFDIKNISRYQSYFNNNSYAVSDVVLYVEIGLDYEFYSNIKDTNTNKNELMLVNKYNKLKSDYIPDLVNIDKKYGGGKMDKNAYLAFKKMCDDALLDNISLKSVSAYRSYSTQDIIYNNYVKKNNQETADTFSARAGHSEHQTGLAVDINTASSSAMFENTKEYKWLIDNSYKYGFILRYPNNKTHITGYKYEPWHFRYVGIDTATKIYLNDITFEEYNVIFL